MEKVMESHGILKSSKSTNPVKVFFIGCLFTEAYHAIFIWRSRDILARETPFLFLA